MLTVKNVTKKYGKVLANNNVSFTVESGEISVLLGPNGAGKSTIIKCICGLLRFDGEILIDNFKNKSPEAKSLLAYVPEMPAVYELLTVEEHLQFMCRSYRIKDTSNIDSLLKRFELYDKKDKLGKELSKGMQQKLSFCCALDLNPKVIIFDEPMVGLDPHAIKELKEIFKELKQSGASVLISTHMLDSVESCWDKAYIMVGGEIKAETAEERKADKSLEELFFEITEGGDNR